jgi:hypothetical protein
VREILAHVEIVEGNHANLCDLTSKMAGRCPGCCVTPGIRSMNPCRDRRGGLQPLMSDDLGVLFSTRRWVWIVVVGALFLNLPVLLVNDEL